MTALLILFRILEGLFLVGMVGSVVVLAITTVEDLAILFERDEPALGITATKEPAESNEPAPAHAR
jgi:hypothetical protein